MATPFVTPLVTEIHSDQVHIRRFLVAKAANADAALAAVGSPRVEIKGVEWKVVERRVCDDYERACWWIDLVYEDPNSPRWVELA